MKLLEKFRSLFNNERDWTMLRWLSLILLIAGLALLCFAADWAILVLIFLAIVGLIELWLGVNHQQVITNWYVPLLPKSIDMPIAIGVPIALIVKLAWMWTNKEQITVWWASAAVIESWIVAHLCSYERK